MTNLRNITILLVAGGTAAFCFFMGLKIVTTLAASGILDRTVNVAGM